MARLAPLLLQSFFFFLPLSATLGDIDTDTLDYLVQDICVDERTNEVSQPHSHYHDPGLGCPAGTISRDLRVGEILPYHKHDRDHATGAIYQLSDAFPRAHAAGNVRVVHTLDFADHGRSVRNITFTQFDVNIDGFNINQYQTEFASIVGTADPSGGVQYFISPTDDGSCTVLDAWGLWDKNLFSSHSGIGKNSGSHLFRLNIVRDISPASANFSCPASYNEAFTTYEIVPNLTFASGKTIKDVLVEQHWAGHSTGDAMSAEKEFFTRAYGLTRWEAWVRNTSRAPSTFCDGVGRTAPGGWTMVDCRDWSYTAADPDGGYVPNRFPTPPYLLAGGNWLDNGDFGRVPATSSWRRPEGQGNSTIWRIETEPNGNMFIVVSAAGSGSGGSLLFQDTTARHGFTLVEFGAQVWLYGDNSGNSETVLELLQMDQSGSVLRSDASNLAVAAGNRVQFRSRKPVAVATGAVTLRFQVFHAGGGDIAVDNCWTGPL